MLFLVTCALWSGSCKHNNSDDEALPPASSDKRFATSKVVSFENFCFRSHSFSLPCSNEQMRWDKPHQLIFPVAEKVVVDKVLQRPVPCFLSSVLQWFTRYQRCWWPHHTVNLSEFMSFFGRSGVDLIGFSNTILFVVIVLGH